MKGSELIKLLKKNGCMLVRHGTSHDTWYSENTEKKFMVPRHKSKEVPIGTYKQIIKEAGINERRK